MTKRTCRYYVNSINRPPLVDSKNRLIAQSVRRPLLSKIGTYVVGKIGIECWTGRLLLLRVISMYSSSSRDIFSDSTYIISYYISIVESIFSLCSGVR